MERPTNRRKIAIGVVASAAAIGAVAVPVIAQASSGSGTTSTATHRFFRGGPGGPGRSALDAKYDALVAGKLGISPSTFESAEQAVRGSMTPPAPGATGPTAGDRAAHRAAEQAALAAKLGVTTTQLTDAEQAAKQTLILNNLPTLVSHKVITQAQADQLTTAAGNNTFFTVLKSIEIDKLTAHLTKAVANHRLTQAQADTILADAKAQPIGDGPGLGLGFGFRGPGGPGGPGRWPDRGMMRPFGAPGASGATGATGYGQGMPPMPPNA
jgi:hypothetical protein